MERQIHDEMEENNQGRYERITQYLSSGMAHQGLVITAVLLYSGTLGASIGYSAILLPQLQANTSAIPTDENTGSWIASLQSGVSPVGTLFGGIIMDRWGRKSAMRAGVLPLFIGYLVLVFAPSHLFVLIGRFITGVACGISSAASSVILCEIATPQLRGVFASSIYSAFSGGILLVYSLGSYLHWRIVAAVLALLPLTSFLMFFFVPESPIWLAKNGCHEEAEIVLRWLRGNEKLAKLELKELLSTIRAQEEIEEESATFDEENGKNIKLKIIHQLRVLLSPSILKPFFIAHVICLFQIFSGTILIIFYAVDLISETNQNQESFSTYIIVQLTAVVRVVFVIITNSLFYFVHRRIHAIVSSSICAATAIIFALFLYFQSQQYLFLSSSANMWISGLLILIFIAANTCSFLALPATIMSEILPIKIRGGASGYIFAANDITQFLVAKCYPWMKETLGPHGVFLWFGINCIIFLVICYLFLPETRGKTLAQIEEYFRGRNYLWVKRDRRLGRDYTRKRYYEMKKINTTSKVATYSEPTQNTDDDDEDDDRPMRNKRKLSVTFS
ncbi:hypothetical protein L9F63_008152 [Diploptera punctata]|uniref:Major facilitator superfamily (MFS) profile domain-containing protein n=1 Tax=Diploptera punctata TaxID=6984 RepID=A0AAD8E2N1_DIPPU|nr:hypothetical protein L9F63_008152 [Diploptera punctata]